MYKCFYAILLFLITLSSYAQNCLPSGINFTSQADIDAFPSNYPNCSQIDGDVFIRFSSSCNGTQTDISNLDSLIQINSIHGSLIINSNPNLIDLSGLNNLVSIDAGLRIHCNHNLTSLSGLNNLVSVGGLTDIGYNFGNDKLTNLMGLSNLVNPSLNIEGNKSFKNFTGLNAASSLQSLAVKDCDSLENFIGLENVSVIHSDVYIFANDSNFDFTGLGNLTTIEGFLELAYNDNQTVNGLTNLNEIQEHLEIDMSPFLNDIDGFSNITSVGAIHIQFTALTSLSGLQNASNLLNPNSNLNALLLLGNSELNDISDISTLDVTGLDDLLIYDNPMLSECAIESVCDAISLNPPISIIVEQNMIGCNSITEVETACSILPVVYSKELIAYKQNEQIILKFSVAQQVNNSHFDIQHSIDRRVFKTIGKIEGIGTTTTELNYEYQHDSPIQGTNYYRIKQVDYDGNFQYGNISSIQYNYESFSISPNPIFSEIIVQSKDSRIPFTIYNIQGEIVLRGILEDNNRINVSHLTKGIYITKFHDSQTKKFLKL